MDSEKNLDSARVLNVHQTIIDAELFFFSIEKIRFQCLTNYKAFEGILFTYNIPTYYIIVCNFALDRVVDFIDLCDYNFKCS